MSKFLVSYKVVENGRTIRQADRTITTKNEFPSSEELEGLRREIKDLESKKAEVVFISTSKLSDK